jgi:hypothetical protein
MVQISTGPDRDPPGAEGTFRDAVCRAAIAYEGRDPIHALSATELRNALGLSDEAVLSAERAGELFSIVRPNRGLSREFPEFQLWQCIAGRPLQEVLAALGRPTGPIAYGFFTSPLVGLAGLTPIQALIGRALDAPEEAREFLQRNADERLGVVLLAAGAYAATLAA